MQSNSLQITYGHGLKKVVTIIYGRSQLKLKEALIKNQAYIFSIKSNSFIVPSEMGLIWANPYGRVDFGVLFLGEDLAKSLHIHG